MRMRMMTDAYEPHIRGIPRRATPNDPGAYADTWPRTGIEMSMRLRLAAQVRTSAEPQAIERMSAQLEGCYQRLIHQATGLCEQRRRKARRAPVGGAR